MSVIIVCIVTKYNDFHLETYVGEEKTSSPEKPLMLGVGRRNMRKADRRTATENSGWAWQIVQRKKEEPVEGVLGFLLNEV